MLISDLILTFCSLFDWIGLIPFIGPPLLQIVQTVCTQIAALFPVFGPV